MNKSISNDGTEKNTLNKQKYLRRRGKKIRPNKRAIYEQIVCDRNERWLKQQRSEKNMKFRMIKFKSQTLPRDRDRSLITYNLRIRLQRLTYVLTLSNDTTVQVKIESS